jgi:hypothetical protein
MGIIAKLGEDGDISVWDTVLVPFLVTKPCLDCGWGGWGVQ